MPAAHGWHGLLPPGGWAHPEGPLPTPDQQTLGRAAGSAGGVNRDTKPALLRASQALGQHWLQPLAPEPLAEVLVPGTMLPATTRRSGGVDAGILHKGVDRTFKEMKGLKLIVKLLALPTRWVGGGERGENEEEGGHESLELSLHPAFQSRGDWRWQGY